MTTKSPPRNLLQASFLKHERAKYLMDGGIPEIQKVQDQSARIVLERGENGWDTVKLIVRPIPVDVTMFVGEVLHNLRASLDYMASAIASHATGKMDERTNFPIYKTKEGFDKARAKHPFAIAAPAVWDFIAENVKPYASDGGNLPLWALSRLNNVDKHRLLLLTFNSTASSQDIIGSNTAHFDNIFIIERPGTINIAEGRDLEIKKSTISSNILITEEGVVDRVPLIELLVEFLNQVHFTGAALQRFFFGDKGAQA